MILADKIIKLRKKNGWSQEELADKMNVSRQAVSKWESAQTIPELDKILQLGTLFSVSTDYLLKDEIEDEEPSPDASDFCIKRISLKEANTYLEERKRAAWRIALATFLCILSPVTLIIMGVASEVPSNNISEELGGIVGLITLFLFITCAVPLFIYTGFKNQPYEFLDKNVPFELEYGVKGIVSERENKFHSTYVRFNIIATCVCIFSPVPLIVSAFGDNVLLSAIMLGVTIIIAGIGASVFIIAGVQNSSMQRLLKEGEFTENEKRKSALREAVGFAYWGVITALYLAVSFISNAWHISWIIFAIGGILFPIIMSVCNIISDKQSKKSKG